MIGLWDREEKKELVKPKITSKELYRMLTQKQKEELPVLRVHYNIKIGMFSCSIWEECGLNRTREIKNESNKVFSIRYNRKELLKHAIPIN